MTPATPAATATAVHGRVGQSPRRWIRNLGAAAAVGVFTGVLLTNLGGVTATTWIDDLGEFGAATAAAAACLRAARRTAGRDRLSWTLIGASCAAWALGQLAWSWFELITKTSPFPSLADVGFLAAIPLMIAGLLSFPRLLSGPVPRIQAGVDALIIAMALLVISWTTVLGRVFAGGGNSALAMGLSLAYPASDVAVVALALLLATRARSSSRTALLFLAGGVAALAISDSSLAYTTSINAGVAVNLDWGWFGGFVLIALAGLEGALATDTAPVRTPLPSPLRAVLLYVVLSVAIAIDAVTMMSRHRLDVMLFATLAALTLLACARQSLAALDAAGMLRKVVRGSVTGLSSRDVLCSCIDEALRTHRDRCMVLVIDVDNLHAVDERARRTAGDALLRVTGRRLATALRGADVAVHLGANRFAMLLSSAEDMDAAAVEAVALQQRLGQPIDLAGTILTLQTTIGLARASSRTVDGDGLVQRAEAAMRVCKIDGTSAVVIVEQEPLDESTMRVPNGEEPAPQHGDHPPSA